MSHYIFRVTEYDWQNNRNNNETTEMFTNSRAAAAYIMKRNGVDMEYYKGWDKFTARTQKDLQKMFDAMPIKSEMRLNRAGSISENCYTVECYISYSEWC